MGKEVQRIAVKDQPSVSDSFVGDGGNRCTVHEGLGAGFMLQLGHGTEVITMARVRDKGRTNAILDGLSFKHLQHRVRCSLGQRFL